MSDENNSLVAPSNALIKSIVRIMRPLVRLLIRRQIGFPFLSQLLKSIYLEVAAELSHDDEKRVTDSRLSLMTGVHRKDVRRLRLGNESIALPETRPASVGAQVISTWLSDYVDEQGNARPLHRLANQGVPSFETLVDDVSRHDVKARSLLDEWVKNGIARIDDQEMVLLQKVAFVPADNFDEKTFFFGHNIHDHMSACVDNLLSEDPRFFERGVYHNNLSPASVNRLKEYVDQEAMDLLKKINSKARAMQKVDSGKNGSHMRFRYGAYFYSDKVNPEPEKMQDKDDE